jgi:hypothetical protein
MRFARGLLRLAMMVLVCAVAGGAQQPSTKPFAPISPMESGCGADTPRLLILGTYHMGNPGQDQYNLTADDVLTPERQRQIAELRGKLAAFQPTKIAVEGDFHTQGSEKSYERYLAGDFQPGRNEIEQIGMVLAKQLGHKRIYPVDYPMWMDGRVPQEIGTTRPRAEEAHGDARPGEKPLNTDRPSEVPAIYAESFRLQRTATVLEYYRFLNSDRYIEADNATYMSLLKPDPNSDALYRKADLLTNWYKRNIRILTNVNRIAQPDDRILLIIGSGHLHILRQLAAESPDICLIDTQQVLK